MSLKKYSSFQRKLKKVKESQRKSKKVKESQRKSKNLLNIVQKLLTYNYHVLPTKDEF